MKRIASFFLLLLWGVFGLTLHASASGGPIGNRFTIRNDTGLEEVNPAVAYNPHRQEYLAVWYNDRPGNDDIRGQRIAWDGRRIGGSFYIAAGAGAERRFPDVAYNTQDHEYLVVWEQFNPATGRYAIYGQRIADDGRLIGTAFPIWNSSVSSHSPAIAYASTANQFLIVWSWDSGGMMHIAGRTYSPATGLGSFFYVFQDKVGSLHQNPDLAYNRARNEFLVVWQEYTAGWMTIQGVRVKMSGGAGVLGPYLVISSDVKGDMANPTVTAIPQPPGVGNYLVAWEDITNASDRDILARGVDGSGNMNAPTYALASSAWDESSPALAGSEVDSQFLAIWVWVPAPTPPGLMEIQGITIPLSTGLLWKKTIGGKQVLHTAVTTGPYGDFFIAFDDNATAGVPERGIYGWLWGTRLYMPFLAK